MTGPTPDTITVNGHRLWRSLMDLAEIGAYDDERTGLRGVNRLALTDADAAGRRQVITWMEQAGLTVRIDRMGNVYGRNDVQAGVVTGVQGISWQEITIHGRAAHAGTTPTRLRADAGLAAARIGVHLRAMVDSGAYGELRATVGHLAVHPDLTNIVPARAELTLDLRNPDDARMARAEEGLAAFLRTLEDDTPGLTLTTRRMAKTAYVPFHERVQKVIAQAADDHGLEHVSLLSGAGHDAQEIAALCPTAMVFVRGEYDGISHNPREYSTPEACAHGVDALATTLLRLATQDPS
ncbi:M20/M25/M40 family metallo-hydrolase [Streptomyces sp. DASNCL29]|uniref:M20/M25/M40 family metallo-hydrolase n=1 Tax=Streptomyces sp. DASNCL29 TaxID=2583819 RepID=UPI00110F6ACA|nr:M20/M25/M40 family metallo-hydrolase [Streptomyces sp. DASNCL29]TMU99718.1 M20 family metallo-hydrolase [Streptomyces sp. DASNCL29]